jgi:hypothetical protein
MAIHRLGLSRARSSSLQLSKSPPWSTLQSSIGTSSGWRMIMILPMAESIDLWKRSKLSCWRLSKTRCVEAGRAPVACRRKRSLSPRPLRTFAWVRITSVYECFVFPRYLVYSNLFFFAFHRNLRIWLLSHLRRHEGQGGPVHHQRLRCLRIHVLRRVANYSRHNWHK